MSIEVPTLRGPRAADAAPPRRAASDPGDPGSAPTTAVLAGPARHLLVVVFLVAGVLGLLAVPVQAETARTARASAGRVDTPPVLAEVMSGRVASGGHFSCVILDGGAVQCWGENVDGRLGIGSTSNIGDDERPTATVALGAGRRATAITAGDYHACALLDDGTVRCWGDNRAGQLGLGHTRSVGDDEAVDSAPPVRLGRPARAVAAGGQHTCALLDDGSVRCWGSNVYGELGIGTTSTIGDDELVMSGSTVPLAGRVVAIAAGANHTCAIRDVGSLHCWGRNDSGQLGVGSSVHIGDNEAVTVVGAVDLGLGRTARTVTAGYGHTCAVLDTGALRCWGQALVGQLGTGTKFTIGDDELPTAVDPVQLGVGRTVVGASASNTRTCALLDDGTMRCFGSNLYGELGIGSVSSVGDDELPTAVAPIAFPGRRVVAVSSAYRSHCAVLDDGAVHCWGSGEYGQLGTGSTTPIGDNELGTAGADVGITGRVGRFPTAPTAVTAAAGNGSVTVSFTVPAFEGAGPVTGYTVTASPGGATATGTASPITVAGLQAGRAYTFTVQAANQFGAGDRSAPSNTVTPPSGPGTPSEPGAPSGYWMVDAAGHVYPFGSAAHHGDPAGTLPGGVTAVDLEATADGAGYWIVDTRGVVHAYGTAAHHGNADPTVLTTGETVTSLSRTPTGTGYWLFTTRGRVLAYGNATHYGDVANLPLNGPVLDSIPTPTGDGYYMVASDGGIFAFGDATFAGSMGGIPLNAPVESLVPDHDGTGYWLVASDGGIFAFDAPFNGSLGNLTLNRPITGMIRYGDGYLMVAEDGGIFTFATAPFLGSLGDNPPAHPITNVAAH